MDQYQLLDEILQSVDMFKEGFKRFQNPVFLPGQKQVAENCTNTIIDLVRQHQEYKNQVPECVPCSNRKITKIGIAVGDAYAPMDSVG